MNAQVSFLEGELSLIHIPLDLYSTFVQPILQVLLPQAHSLSLDEDSDTTPEGLTAQYKHSFLNLSITPVECSIVCHTYWAKTVFEPAIRSLPRDAAKHVSISKNSYVALCVMSGGMDAGSRVVDLSSPLALAGIPIFFVTTYYSDFILVPTKDRQSVIQALMARGFELSQSDASFVSPGSLSHPYSHAKMGSTTSLRSEPSTPPPSNQDELQNRTFNLLRKQSVVPYITPGLSVVHCSGHGTSHVRGEYSSGHRPSANRGFSGSSSQKIRPSWVDTVDTKLYTCLVSALALHPQFLSVTLTALDPPSILLDKALLPIFGTAVVGDVDLDLVPIFLNLVDLPFEATGIVSGVAGKLVSEMAISDVPELSYLSTSKAGAVILDSEHAHTALQILQPLLEKGDR